MAGNKEPVRVDVSHYAGGAHEDPPLSEQQLMLMAYVDDELPPEQRQAFESELAANPALAAEVVHHQNLMAMAQSMAHLEPSDHESRRFWARFYNRTEWRLGWCLLLVGVVVLLGELLYLLWVSEWFPITAKIALLLIVVGGGILLWNTIRLRMRTSQFDRYRGVMR